MRLFAPFSKIDAEQRMVWGYASTEARDDQGEIVKREALQAALPEWFKLGNVREMHQLSAVGKAKSADMDDKGLFIGAKIVDPIAWQKVQEGVYNGFSIGGRVTKRDPSDHKTITGIILNEISVVDRPANPEALFDCWKAAAAEPVRRGAHWDCGNPEHHHNVRPAAVSCMQKAAGEITNMPDGEAFNSVPLQIWACSVPEHRHLAKSDAAACLEGTEKAAAAPAVRTEDAENAADETVEKAVETAVRRRPNIPTIPEDVAAVRAIAADEANKLFERAARAVLNADAAIEKKTEEPYGDVDYADPGYRNGKKRYPVDTEEHIRAAWSYINQAKNSKKYTSEQLSHIKSKIVSAWKSKIDKDGPPSADEKAAQTESLRKSLWDVARLTDLVQELRYMAQGLAAEAAMEREEPTMADKAQTLVDEMCAFLMALAGEETREIMSGTEIAPEIDLVALALSTPNASSVSKGIEMLIAAATGPEPKHQLGAPEKQRYEEFRAALAAGMNSREIGKAGARHSKDDQAMLDLAYHAAATAGAMGDTQKHKHAAAAADALKAAGAGTTDAAIESGPHQAGPGNSTTDTGHNAEHAAPNQTPPAREYDGGNSTVDTGGNATHDAPQVDPSGTGAGTGIDHMKSIAVLDLLKASGNGFATLCDVAHMCCAKVSDGATCGMAGKAGARHSVETMGHLHKAHGHLMEAGVVCGKADNSLPGGKPTTDGEGEHQGTVFEHAAGGADDLVKVAAQRDELLKTLGTVLPRFETMTEEFTKISARLTQIESQPLPAKTIAGDPEAVTAALKTLGISEVEKNGAPVSDDTEYFARFEKMSSDEQTMELIRLSRVATAIKGQGRTPQVARRP